MAPGKLFSRILLYPWTKLKNFVKTKLDTRFGGFGGRWGLDLGTKWGLDGRLDDSVATVVVGGSAGDVFILLSNSVDSTGTGDFFKEGGMVILILFDVLLGFSVDAEVSATSLLSVSEYFSARRCWDRWNPQRCLLMLLIPVTE
jgi:hypothetical protein